MYVVFERSSLDLGTNTDSKFLWMEKGILCKCKSKESCNNNTHVIQNSL